VVGFQVETQGITVYLNDGIAYTYTAATAGPTAIATMCKLAHEGRGLHRFIDSQAKGSYAFKRLWR
jgi:hypothetical protein